MATDDTGRPRVGLRPWRAGDEAQLVALANNWRVWRNMTNRFPHPYGDADARTWIFEIANAEPADARHWAIVAEERVVGGAGVERLHDLHTRSAEIGYWLGEEHWGRGIATEALRLATDEAFRDFDFVRLQAGVLSWNPASCRVLEKVGYSLEGCHRAHVFKDGEVCDQWMYARLRP